MAWRIEETYHIFSCDGSGLRIMLDERRVFLYVFLHLLDVWHLCRQILDVHGWDKFVFCVDFSTTALKVLRAVIPSRGVSLPPGILQIETTM